MVANVTLEILYFIDFISLTHNGCSVLFEDNQLMPGP